MDESTPVNNGQDSGAQNEPSQNQPNNETADQRVETPDEQGLSSREADQSQEQQKDQSSEEAPEQSQSEKTKDNTAKFDEDLDAWAEKRGYGKLETEKERRMAQDARNQQRNYHKERSKESQVENEVKDLYTTDNEELDDVEIVKQNQARLETQLYIRDFFDANPEARQLEGKMAELVTEERKKYGVLAAQYLSQDLNRLYILAKADSQSDIADQARKDERQLLAKKQAAAPPEANAQNHQQSKTGDPAAAIREMSPEEYRKRRAAGWNPLQT